MLYGENTKRLGRAWAAWAAIRVTVARAVRGKDTACKAALRLREPMLPITYVSMPQVKRPDTHGFYYSAGLCRCFRNACWR